MKRPWGVWLTFALTTVLTLPMMFLSLQEILPLIVSNIAIGHWNAIYILAGDFVRLLIFSSVLLMLLKSPQTSLLLFISLGTVVLLSINWLLWGHYMGALGLVLFSAPAFLLIGALLIYNQQLVKNGYYPEKSNASNA